MEINIKHFKTVDSEISFLLYCVLSLLIEETEYAREYLKKNPKLKEKLAKDEWIQGKGNNIIPSFKAAKILQPPKEDTIYILDKFNELKEQYLGITHKSKMVASTKKVINGRLKYYTVEEICGVLEFKFQEWANTPYEKYLRFETLLAQTKFEGYITQYYKYKEDNEGLSNTTFTLI